MSTDKYPNIFSNSRQIKAIVYLFVLFMLLAVRYFQQFAIRVFQTNRSFPIDTKESQTFPRNQSSTLTARMSFSSFVQCSSREGGKKRLKL